MHEIYVHTLRYHYYRGGKQQSRTMFPISYGPFKDEDAAREWIRQRGITRATKLMADPATENIQVTPSPLLAAGEGSNHNTILRMRVQQNTLS